MKKMTGTIDDTRVDPIINDIPDIVYFTGREGRGEKLIPVLYNNLTGKEFKFSYPCD